MTKTKLIKPTIEDTVEIMQPRTEDTGLVDAQGNMIVRKQEQGSAEFYAVRKNAGRTGSDITGADSIGLISRVVDSFIGFVEEDETEGPTFKDNHPVLHKVAVAGVYGLAALASAGLVGAITLGNPGQAQADYFDGCRGPNTFQLDQRLTLGEGAAGYKLLPKFFVDNDEDGNGFFGVTPFIYTPGQKPIVGVGAGMFLDVSKNLKILGVVPVVYNAEGEALNINPTLYATIMAGKLLIDPRISYNASINEQGTIHNLSWGTTVGLMIDNVVIGGDVETGFDPANAQGEQLRENLKYGGIIRVDLDKEHKNWLQTYVNKDAVSVGFRANF